MKKVNYIRYQRYELISTFLGVMVWVSLGTFSIITKGLLDIDIDVDFTLVDFSRDFDYEKTVKINNSSTILKFSVKRHGWKQSFVKSFIKVYNNNINKG